MNIKLLYLTFAIVLVTAVVAVSNYLELRTSEQYKVTFSKALGSTVRLVNPHSDFQFCSGTVVTKTQVLTAAHCLREIPPNEIIRIESYDGALISFGIVQSVSEDRIDYGTISGDFSMFPQVPVETSALSIERSMSNNKLMGCGYPYGGNLSCTMLSNCRHFAFVFACEGFVYPVMSGSAVIDVDTNEIVAVMRGVTNLEDYSQIRINPTVSLWKGLGIGEGQ